MKVKVNDGWQVKHDGKIQTGGAVITVNDELAQRWIAQGLVSETTAKSAAEKAAAPEKATTSSKNKAQTSSANKAAKS